MSRSHRLLVLLLLLGAPLLRGTAQATDPLAGAIADYRALELDAAAGALRALLEPAQPGSPALRPADRSRALMYLGAAEFFQERRRAAIEAISALLIHDPRYRPDDLLFPPEVTAFFQEVRLGVRAVLVVAPDSLLIASEAHRLPIRLYASTLHDVRAVILDPRGSPVRLLHEGAVGDSLEVLWNAREASGRLFDSGTYMLRATSRAPNGQAVRSVEIPLRLVRLTRDTLPHPAASQEQLRAETRPPQRSWRPAVVSLLAAGAVVALPSAIGMTSDAMAARFAVTGAITAAGIAGLVVRSRPIPIPENVEWNRSVRAAWEDERARVQRENAARTSDARLLILAGPPRTVEAP